MSLSIYQRHMGTSYTELAPEGQAFHALHGSYRLRGEVDVIGAETFLGRLLSLIMRFPASSPQQAFEFHLQADNEQEVWQRRFPGRTMQSSMRLHGRYLVENFGPMQCRFILCADRGTLLMEPRGIRWFGLPLPAFILPQIAASERGADGKLHFDVSARWPGKYLTVAYRGWLDVDNAEPLP